MIKCVIIEDEPLAMERAKVYVEKLSFLQLLATFDNGIDAFTYLGMNEVDLIFLDINLGDLSGIQLLESLKKVPHVIIITAYHVHALKGFELNVTDYLLKPYTFQRFLQAVERVRDDLSKTVTGEAKKFIFIKTEYRLEKVMLHDIVYIEGMRDYRRIHTVDKQIMTLHTFKDLEKEIPSDILCRVHKSYMVSIDKIESIERDRIKIGKKLIPVSETYKKELRRRINHGDKIM
jgi:DNA-binding LytR/AlgR family response regulator